MKPVTHIESLPLTLFDIGAIRLGQFKLHSGRVSPIYIDLRLLASYPDALRRAAFAYRQLLEPLDFDLLAATPLAGLPIGTAISLEMDIPLIYPRQIPKSYGMGKRIEGVWKEGQKAVIVDDLITSGDSLLQGIDSLKDAGLQVVDAVVLIDRQQGGREMLRQQGYRLHAVVTLGEILSLLVKKERITSSQQTHVLRELQEEKER